MKNFIKSHKIAFIVILVLIVIGIFFSLANFITDWMWFAEMGYVDVFLKQLVTELEVGIPAFIIITILMKIYLGRIRKSYFKDIISHEETDMKKLNRNTNILAVLFGLIASFVFVSKLWFGLLQFANATDFDTKDPLFNFDISFYIFKLDFLSVLSEILIGLIIAFLLLTAVYYIMLISMHRPDTTYEEIPESEMQDNPFGDSVFGKVFEKAKGSAPSGSTRVKSENFHQLMNIASRQITVMGILFFLMLGFNFFLNQFDLLHSHTGVVYGAGFVDVNIKLWMFRVLMALAVVGAVLMVVFMKKKQYLKLLAVPAIMIAVGIIGAGASFITQNFVVSPDEISKESEYLANNIKYTQAAYDLKDIDIRAFSAENNLTSEDLDKNTETVSNIRINDYQPVKTFYNQTQSIRQYYMFNDVDVDRYKINGELTQTYLSAREIDEDKISDTWMNRHLKYTHGYGATLSRVNKITASGQPDVLIGNIPSKSSVPNDIAIDNNAIYFGEKTNDYIVVGTDEQEFDYPDGESNQYTNYQGNAGISMNLLNRILFSIREGSLKMLVSTNIDSDSKIIINRNVMDRIKTIMPYLMYDGQPYMVTVGGKLYWIADAYTTSSNYPYSEPYSVNDVPVNYIRNSVKVVVDAYNGDTNFYIADKTDPIIQTYAKIYPTLFKSIDDMDSQLREHVRYPQTMMTVQSKVYGKYHMNDVNVFYQNEDAWDIANETYGTETQKMIPNYYIYKLPGEQKAEFVSSIAYTPKSKQNMTGLLVARNDGENYGKLVLYEFPKSKTIYGSEQVEAMIDQNAEISKEFSLWNSSGSKYTRGHLFIVPIEDSILYVEPVYLEATNSSIPEVKRVILVYGDKIAYKETLGEAIESMFGKSNAAEQNKADGKESSSSGTTTQSSEPSQSSLITQAQEAFDKAQNAQKNGDWAGYGEYIKQLGETLKKLKK